MYILNLNSQKSLLLWYQKVGRTIEWISPYPERQFVRGEEFLIKYKINPVFKATVMYERYMGKKVHIIFGNIEPITDILKCFKTK